VTNLPTKVLCDTNFLLIPIRFGIDIFSNSNDALNDMAKFFVSSRVLDEIKTLMKTAKPSFQKELQFALKIADMCELIEDNTEILVDESLIKLALKTNMILGTTDSELRKKARERCVKVLFLRQKRYLVLDG
jgi:rRNA-processing protein FCF1